MFGNNERRRFALALLAIITACGPAKPPPPPPPPVPPQQATQFLAAFAAAQAKRDPALRSDAARCVTTVTFVACDLVPGSPASAAPSRLIVSLNKGEIASTKVEGPLADTGPLFGALTAIAALQGEPLNTERLVSAFKSDLGLASKPKAGKLYTAHRTYGDIACAATEQALYSCVFTPGVTMIDLPAPKLTADEAHRDKRKRVR